MCDPSDLRATSSRKTNLCETNSRAPLAKKTSDCQLRQPRALVSCLKEEVLTHLSAGLKSQDRLALLLRVVFPFSLSRSSSSRLQLFKLHASGAVCILLSASKRSLRRSPVAIKSVYIARRALFGPFARNDASRKARADCLFEACAALTSA